MNENVIQIKNSPTELLETVSCNLCGANQYTVIYPAQYTDSSHRDLASVFRSSGDEILIDQLVQCNKCGLQYLNPRLKSDVIIDGYTQGEDPVFVSQAKGREITFAKNLKLIERYMPRKGKILDVGTAGGSFLAVAKERGWQIAGCEPNEWLTKWAKSHYGIEVFAGTIFDMKLPDQSFDVVTLWDVLEHTSDPKKVLSECQRVLKPNGLLIINYPDIGSLVSKAMGRKWVFLLSIHLYYFTVPTIHKMLNNLGFAILKTKKHWQTLEVDYIFTRMKPYAAWLATGGQAILRMIGCQKMQVPYWMGQTLVIAKKK